MGRRRDTEHDPRLRLLIAQCAARIMAEEGLRDFALAKRKAASQFEVGSIKNLPRNEEIQAELEAYQRLFHSNEQPQLLQQQRATALQAMQLFDPFKPCLVGPVLDGSADAHTPVYLHLFAATGEEVLIFLLEQGIPFEQGERQVKYADGRRQCLPKFSFMAGDNEIQLTVFPPKARAQSPLSPIDGRPQRRADRKQLLRIIGEQEDSG